MQAAAVGGAISSQSPKPTTSYIANAARIDELAQRGITISSLRPETRLHPGIFIEPPIQVTKEIRWDTAVSLGAFSMLHGPGHIVAASIGRYCSMAPSVTIGSNEHAMSWLSTTSLVESPTLYGWHERVSPSSADLDLSGNYYNDSIRQTTIGNDVWIGHGAFVRGGVTIGNGAIIGSMANVVHDVPDYAIVAGNPARLIRYRFDHELITRFLKLQWWRYSIFDLMRFDLTNPAVALDAIERTIQNNELEEYAPVRVTPSDIARA